ncbi:isoleucine--tRNA ligase [[Phormidium] sp. ETS-05]|uniref:isoleucine--tRNA ligase n=1 Tax=[Phormidium] sp. ETS-05 TaxID=222819 RepID=UPI0018EF0558|nr:isoleucine--tRNA ligase [[Phormidium] sp. ETS-05]
MTEAKTYKDTVNLPQTNFDMRANAAVREPEIQKFWADNQIYEQLSQQNPGEIFILHDGPPYANGDLHIGHALNKILKDIINRYQLLQGRKVRYVPGWDCHGLPIELKVLQAMKPEEREKLTPIKLRQKARTFALKTVEKQSQDFQRYGVWGDWTHPYLSLLPEYEAAQIGVFGDMVLKGYIYRGRKPVHWSPSSKTALAEAELEYPEGHTSRSIYAAFPMTALAPAVPEDWQEYLPQLQVAIWTTTPWTIPGNLAVSVNPDLNYAVVEGAEGKYYIVAADLVSRLAETLQMPLVVKSAVKGVALEGSKYRHPLFDRESQIVIGGDYVTTESGTGLVHTAPGHGLEDYAVGLRYGLPILAPVDEDGNFTAEAGEFAGLNVLDEGNAAVVKALAAAGAMLKEEPYQHKYPYDWRTKQPTIFRATEQWFASVEGFRELALKAIGEVNWIPGIGQNRITAMVSERSDWCISRQRSWGVPIPVFYDEESGEPLLNAETISHVQGIIAEKGSDAWWQMATEALLPESYRNNGRKYRKGTDTMDVWFDSGSSWAAVANTRPELKYPVDMYLEGSDQHRGWFQSSLLTSVATQGHAPYKTVLTHGFVLDENGRKMSKSIGNVVDPKIVIAGGKNQKEEPAYGADVLRLWVSSVDYSADVPLGKNILKQMADVYRKIRNTARFLLGNLHDFDPAKDAVPYEQLPELDRYMLHRMTEVFTEVKDAFDSFQFFRFFQTVQNFCVVDLSNFYLDIAKDRLYISAPAAFRRRSCQTVLAVALENLARSIAPVLCHMAEDIWQNIPYPTGYKSVFQAGWVNLDEQWRNPELGETWSKIRKIRAEVNQVMESARQNKYIGSSLEAKVLLYLDDVQLRQKFFGNEATTESSTAGATSPSLSPTAAVNTEVDSPAESSRVGIALSTGEATTQNSSSNAHPTGESNLLSQFIDSNPSLQQAAEVWGKFSAAISPLIQYGERLLSDYERVVTTGVLLVAAFVFVYVSVVVLDTVNHLPLLPNLFEYIGIGCTLWFARGNLLFADDRDKLSAKLQTWKDELVGTPSLEGLQPSQRLILSDDVVVEEQLTNSGDEPRSFGEIVPVDMPMAVASNQSQNAADYLTPGNGVDEWRYLLIASQVELVPSAANLDNVEYKLVSESLGVGVVKADGEKCDRCWNYSLNVGVFTDDPTICDRCVAALAGEY